MTTGSETRYGRIEDFFGPVVCETFAAVGCGEAQCGFCTPGFIVSAKALLAEIPDPTREQVRDWFTKYRNACRCTGYKQLVDAAMDTAKVLNGRMKAEDPMFKMPADGEIGGSRHPRPSAVAKVTGTLDYGADLGLKRHRLRRNTGLGLIGRRSWEDHGQGQTWAAWKRPTRRCVP